MVVGFGVQFVKMMLILHPLPISGQVIKPWGACTREPDTVFHGLRSHQWCFPVPSKEVLQQVQPVQCSFLGGGSCPYNAWKEILQCQKDVFQSKPYFLKKLTLVPHFCCYSFKKSLKALKMCCGLPFSKKPSSNFYGFQLELQDCKNLISKALYYRTAASSFGLAGSLESVGQRSAYQPLTERCCRPTS